MNKQPKKKTTTKNEKQKHTHKNPAFLCFLLLPHVISYSGNIIKMA